MEINKLKEELQVYTVKEVADVFSKSTRTVDRWIKSGALPAKRIGASYYIRRSDIEVLLKK